MIALSSPENLRRLPLILYSKFILVRTHRLTFPFINAYLPLSQGVHPYLKALAPVVVRGLG